MGGRYKVAHFTTRQRWCLLGHTHGLPPGPMLQKHHIAIDHMSRDCGDQQLSYPHTTMPTGWEVRTQMGHAWILSLQATAHSCVILGNTLIPKCTQELPRNPELGLPQPSHGPISPFIHKLLEV